MSSKEIKSSKARSYRYVTSLVETLIIATYVFRGDVSENVSTSPIS